MVPPSASRRGRASSKPAGVPPAMMTSFASRAPSTPPLTGQSRNSTPRGSRSAAAWRAVSAPMVEQSSISAPDLNPGARARVTSSTSASADTHETTASTPAASCSSVAGAATLSSEASLRALSALRFQTALSIPARWRLRAMCCPMAPSPTKAARIGVGIPGTAQAAVGPHYRASGGTRGIEGRDRCSGASAVSSDRAAAESARGGLGRIHLRLGDRFRLDGLGFGYRLVRCVLRHAAAPVLHVLARLLAISVSCSVREIFALAVLVLLEHAAGLDRPHVAILGVLAQDFARLGDILLHRSRVGLIAELGGDAVVPCREALLLRGARRGVESHRVRLDRFDEHRPRHPLIAVVRHALLIGPAIDIRPGDVERSGENQGGDG